MNRQRWKTTVMPQAASDPRITPGTDAKCLIGKTFKYEISGSVPDLFYLFSLKEETVYIEIIIDKKNIGIMPGFNGADPVI